MKTPRALGIVLLSASTFVVTTAWLAADAQATGESYQIAFPLGVDGEQLQIPADNPISAAKVDLGKLLYFDTRLSKDSTVSCATCHDPAKGFTDQLRVSKGIRGQLGGRNAPSVINSAFNLFQFWDGRAATLEEQAKGPIANPIEMGGSHELCVQTVASIDGYKAPFKAAFGSEQVTIDRVAQAIASFERTVLSGNSAWDRYVYGSDKAALSDSAKRGLELFEGKANCTRCHVGFNLSDSLFHNLGVGMAAEKPDLGRYVVTKEEKEKGAFKTPILRDLQRTAPYMHDGSVATLEAVIDLYDRGGESNAWLDPKMVKLGLTKQEKADLVAFLRSLEGDWKPMAPPTLPK